MSLDLKNLTFENFGTIGNIDASQPNQYMSPKHSKKIGKVTIVQQSADFTDKKSGKLFDHQKESKDPNSNVTEKYKDLVSPKLRKPMRNKTFNLKLSN